VSADRIRAPWWLKPGNKVMMMLLRRGVSFGSEHPVVLTAPGRKSGRPRSTPVTPVHVDGQRYVVATFPAADWVANVRAADAITLADGRRAETIRMVELEAHQAAPVLRMFGQQVPAGVGFLKRSGVLTDGTPDELAGLAGRLPVFRIDCSVGGMSNSERIRPPWWLKYVNKAMIGMQRLGVLGDKGPVILVVPGRRTGKLRSTPITPMTVEGKQYVLVGLPGSDWAANARAAGEVELRRGRNTERVRMVELPPDEARPLLRLFPTEVPTGVGFLKNAGLVTGPNPDEYEALAGRCPVFRFEPVTV
jgi:deazaflavin-dependent oxidoreductase (nitroreductase family)